MEVRVVRDGGGESCGESSEGMEEVTKPCLDED